MSKLLINESPLQVLPSLAEAIGLKEAIVLQQIHWWLNASTNEHNGYVWVYNTYSEWQEQFPFWSESTVRRTIRSLEDDGYLVSAKPHEDKGNRTKWYRIDYDALDDLESDPPCGSDEQMGVQDDRRGVQDEQSRARNNARARQENTTENTPEDTNSREREVSDPVKVMEDELRSVREFYDEHHELRRHTDWTEQKCRVLRKVCAKSRRDMRDPSKANLNVVLDNFDEAWDRHSGGIEVENEFKASDSEYVQSLLPDHD